MQHEGVGIPSQLCHDERHALRHKASHECYVAGEPIQFRDYDEAFGSACGTKSCRQLRSTIKSIGALSRFRFRVFADDCQPLGCGEAFDRRSRAFDAKARVLLSLRRNSKICDGAAPTKLRLCDLSHAVGEMDLSLFLREQCGLLLLRKAPDRKVRQGGGPGRSNGFLERRDVS